MRVLIYGGGAVGLGLASCLIKAGAQVHILMRPAAAERLRAEGFVRSGLFGEFEARPGTFTVSGSLAEMPVGGGFDFILLCIKSVDTEAAAMDLAAHAGRLGPETKIVLCQNGWGNREVFLARLTGFPVYSARVITGFRRPAENAVEITVHADAMHLGALGGEDLAPLAPLGRAIEAGGLPCRVTDNIGHDLWAKMLYNCSLNPLGAVFDVPYGTLAESGHARAIMNELHEEIFRVMQAAGYETHWPDAAAYQADFYGRLVPATAGHFSSTLQDIRAGKRTEIDALNGAVVKLGNLHHISVPVNKTVYRLVKFREERKVG